jgi:hypothetical protein
LRGGKLPPLRGGASARYLLTVALALLAGSARADLWGYLDDQGSAHFATEKLDERYQLFFKGETNLDAPRGQPAALAPNEEFSHARALPVHHQAPRRGEIRAADRARREVEQSRPRSGQAVIAVESAFEPTAISPKGALGLIRSLRTQPLATASSQTRHGPPSKSFWIRQSTFRSARATYAIFSRYSPTTSVSRLRRITPASRRSTIQA